MAEIIVVLGPPGSGKSYHCQKIVASSGSETVLHLSAGNLLRGIRTGTLRSKYEAAVNDPDAPVLLDHNLVNNIMFEQVNGKPSEIAALVDGYPRFKDAVGVFMETIGDNRHTFLGCINFNLSLETSIARLSIRPERTGDKPDWAKLSYMERRYDEYLRYTLSAIEGIREFGRVIDVDAEPDINTVWNNVYSMYRELIFRKGRNG